MMYSIHSQAFKHVCLTEVALKANLSKQRQMLLTGCLALYHLNVSRFDNDIYRKCHNVITLHVNTA